MTLAAEASATGRASLPPDVAPTWWARVFALDPRSLAAFRSALACIVLVDLAARTADLKEHYSDAGALPRAALVEAHGRLGALSLHALGGSVAFEGALFALAAVFGVMLLVGYRAPWAAAGSWVLAISLQARNPAILTGGDLLLTLLLCWQVLLPPTELAPLVPTRRSTPRLSSGNVGLTLQVLCLYWFTAAHKARQPEWLDGTAVEYVLHHTHATTRVGLALLAYPGLLRALTYGVLLFEIVGPLVMIAPFFGWRLRVAAVLGFAVMHVSFGATIEIGIFPWVSCVAVMPFLPAQVWETRVGARVIDGVARVWERIGALLRTPRGDPSCAQNSRDRAGRTRSVLACALLFYVVWSNVDSFHPPLRMPARLATLGAKLGINQAWTMYAEVRGSTGWLVIPGALSDGTSVDLLRGDAPVRWDKPAVASAMHGGARRQAFMANVLQSAWLAPPLADYLCRKWNDAHGAAMRLEELELVWMREDPLPDRTLTPPRRFSLLKQRCAS